MPFKVFLLFIAIVFVIGMAFIFGVNAFVNQNTHDNSLTNLAPVTKAPVSFDLEVSAPEDEILVFDKSVLVSGTSSPDAQVIVTNGKNSKEVDADSKGEFSQLTALTPGLNYIYISAFDDQGNTKQLEKTVYYSEEKL